MGVAITGLPVPEWRPCTISGGTVTALYEFSTAPTAADVVQGSISYQLSNDVDEANDSFQAQVLTDRSDHKYLALGCMMDKLAMSFQAAGLPTAKASIMAASASDGESDALGTPSKPPVYPWMGAHAIIAPHGDPTYDAGDAYALKGQNTCELMRGLQNSQNPNSLQGYDGYDTVLSDFLTAAVNVPMDDKWADEWGASPGGGGGAEYQLMLSNTRVAGSFFGVYGSKVLQSDKPKDSDEGGILQNSLSLTLDTTWDNSGVVVGVA